MINMVFISGCFAVFAMKDLLPETWPYDLVSIALRYVITEYFVDCMSKAVML